MVAFGSSDFAARSENTSSNKRSRNSETVVGVFELWRNTRTRRSAGNLYVVPPGATSRGSAASVGRPLRISFRRVTVVGGGVPVVTPLMHVVTQIVKRSSNAERNREAAREVYLPTSRGSARHRRELRAPTQLREASDKTEKSCDLATHNSLQPHATISRRQASSDD
jgi:hypothetical protein